MRQVVFVDDDEAVLGGLRRMLHTLRRDWQMRFVPDAATALAALEEQPADVVVVDMRIPGTDGAALLAEVQQRWPATVRIVLSGFADEATALRTVAVAHRYLSKPCEPRNLIAAVGSALHLQERLTCPDLRRLVGQLGALPSPPRTFAEISAALARPDAGPESVAAVIEQDAGCSAKLLQLVNSAFFGLARQMSQVRDAVAYLGIGRVRTLVLATEATSVFTAADGRVAQFVEQVNDHGHQVGLVAQQLAGKQAHDAFVAGLLHDIGQLVMVTVRPQSYLDLVAEAKATGAGLLEAERAALGSGHPEVGAYLLHLWGLPYVLVEAVARHHDLDATDDADPVVAAVAAASAAVAG